jgi:hypothetical protein
VKDIDRYILQGEGFPEISWVDRSLGGVLTSVHTPHVLPHIPVVLTVLQNEGFTASHKQFCPSKYASEKIALHNEILYYCSLG